MSVVSNPSGIPDEGDATRVLLVKYQDRLLSLARQMLGRHDRLRRMVGSEDLVQEASLRLINVLDTDRRMTTDEFCRFANVQVCRALADLARNLYGPRGYGRNTIPAADLPSEAGGAMGAAVDTGVTPSSLAGDADLWELLYREAANLPEEESLVFELLWFERLGQLEAANRLGVSERTIRKRWNNVKQKLGRYLRQLEG